VWGELSSERKDSWYRRAKREGYRARSAYKLKQIQEKFDVIGEDDRVLDLGAAPGGWLQVASELTDGAVMGVDLKQIETLEGVETVQGDFNAEYVVEDARERLGGAADVVICDAAPDLTGNWDVDHARSVSLAKTALDVCGEVLVTGGNFVVKVFQGRDLKGFVREVETRFTDSRRFSPEASRKRSSEIYVVGKGFVTAPVDEGDVLEVEISEQGEEGDGLARVDGYVLFVPDTEPGDVVEVRVEETKEQFGFAEKV